MRLRYMCVFQPVHSLAGPGCQVKGKVQIQLRNPMRTSPYMYAALEHPWGHPHTLLVLCS